MDEQNGMLILDVTNPGLPVQVGSFATPAGADRLAVVGDYAYVAGVGDGLLIIDVSNHSLPHLVGQSPVVSRAVNVAIDGGYAYVADDTFGLQVIDVADPANPQPAGSYQSTGWTMSVAAGGGFAYLTDVWSGLRVLALSDLQNIIEVGYYVAPAIDVAVSGTIAYVAGGRHFSTYECAGAMPVEPSSPEQAARRLTVGPAFPNPFNPRTSIDYALPVAAGVELRVFDATGRLVATSSDGWRHAGRHRIDFEAPNLMSGVYTYRVEAAGLIASGRMVLIK
jgi:hypothetical protein